jgi:nitroreductase
MLAAAATSPYAAGRHDWRVEVVDDPETIAGMADQVREKAAALSGRMRRDHSESFGEYARFFTIFQSAPLVLVPVFRCPPALSLMVDEPDTAVMRLERESYVKSISCVAMLVLLAAEALGLGGCFMTGPLIAEEELARLLKIGSGSSIAALIPVGYPEETLQGEESWIPKGG